MAFTIAAAPPFAMAPNMATPIAPAAWREVFKTAEAVPDKDFSTLAKMPVVIAGTAAIGSI